MWKSPATYVPGVLPAAVQVTSTLCVAAHDAAGSPSLTVTLTVAVPGAAQVKVGFWAVASLSVPLVAFQAKVSALGPASVSCAGALRATLPPTCTSAGLAPTPSMVGHRFSEPDTMTLPVRGAS